MSNSNYSRFCANCGMDNDYRWCNCSISGRVSTSETLGGSACASTTQPAPGVSSNTYPNMPPVGSASPNAAPGGVGADSFGTCGYPVNSASGIYAIPGSMKRYEMGAGSYPYQPNMYPQTSMMNMQPTNIPSFMYPSFNSRNYASNTCTSSLNPQMLGGSLGNVPAAGSAPGFVPQPQRVSFSFLIPADREIQELFNVAVYNFLSGVSYACRPPGYLLQPYGVQELETVRRYTRVQFSHTERDNVGGSGYLSGLSSLLYSSFGTYPGFVAFAANEDVYEMISISSSFQDLVGLNSVIYIQPVIVGTSMFSTEDMQVRDSQSASLAGAPRPSYTGSSKKRKVVSFASGEECHLLRSGAVDRRTAGGASDDKHTSTNSKGITNSSGSRSQHLSSPASGRDSRVKRRGSKAGSRAALATLHADTSSTEGTPPRPRDTPQKNLVSPERKIDDDLDYEGDEDESSCASDDSSSSNGSTSSRSSSSSASSKDTGSRSRKEHKKPSKRALSNAQEESGSSSNSDSECSTSHPDGCAATPPTSSYSAVEEEQCVEEIMSKVPQKGIFNFFANWVADKKLKGEPLYNPEVDMFEESSDVSGEGSEEEEEALGDCSSDSASSSVSETETRNKALPPSKKPKRLRVRKGNVSQDASTDQASSSSSDDGSDCDSNSSDRNSSDSSDGSDGDSSSDDGDAPPAKSSKRSSKPEVRASRKSKASRSKSSSSSSSSSDSSSSDSSSDEPTQMPSKSNTRVRVLSESSSDECTSPVRNSKDAERIPSSLHPPTDADIWVGLSDPQILKTLDRRALNRAIRIRVISFTGGVPTLSPPQIVKIARLPKPISGPSGVSSDVSIFSKACDLVGVYKVIQTHARTQEQTWSSGITYIDISTVKSVEALDGDQICFAPKPSVTPKIDYENDHESIRKTLKRQLAFYFSEQNFPKDLYLRSLMDSEGWITCEKILEFNKIKKLTTSAEYIMELASQLIYVETKNCMYLGPCLRLKDHWKQFKIQEQIKEPEPVVEPKKVVSVPKPNPFLAAPKPANPLLAPPASTTTPKPDITTTTTKPDVTKSVGSSARAPSVFVAVNCTSGTATVPPTEVVNTASEPVAATVAQVPETPTAEAEVVVPETTGNTIATTDKKIETPPLEDNSSEKENGKPKAFKSGPVLGSGIASTLRLLRKESS